MLQTNVEVLIRSVWFVFLGAVAAIAPGAGPAALSVFIAKEDIRLRDLAERYTYSLIGVVGCSVVVYGVLSPFTLVSVAGLTTIFWGKYLYWRLYPVQRVSPRPSIPHW
jgi:hypothetical protein